MQDVIQEFGHDVAALVYWLTDPKEGNRQTRNLISAWRLASAPMAAKLIKFADILDNAHSIREHDRGFFTVWASEKRAILTRMLEVEGSGLTEHRLFKEAWSAVVL
jgi:(p)ppGpp synthase/HD superfamily hydrolase